MRIGRRGALGGGAFLLSGVGVGGFALSERRVFDTANDALARRYHRLSADLADAWWDPGSNMSDGLPGIRATDGSGGWNNGQPGFNNQPPSISNARGESFWQEAQYFHFLSNDRKLRTGGVLAEDSQAALASARLVAQRQLWHTIYTSDELAGDGSSDGTINVSDDAAWKLQALKAIHELTGSAEDLQTLRAAIRSVLLLYVDSFTPGHRRTSGDLIFSAFGCLYAQRGQDPNGQGRSTTYETGIMDAALYVAKVGGIEDHIFRDYAQTAYQSFRATLQQLSGIYFQTLQLDPTSRFDSTPFLKPIDAGKPRPRQDYDGVTIGGTMGMAVVASELFRQTGDRQFHSDALHIVSGIGSEYLQNGCIICDRDPWTAGFWGYDFAVRVLSLPGADPNGAVAEAIIATANRILQSRTPIDVYSYHRAYGYSAEWSGNTQASIGESRIGANDGIVSWEANGAKANNGRGGGQASPNQIMTSSSSGTMVQAAVHLVYLRK